MLGFSFHESQRHVTTCKCIFQARLLFFPLDMMDGHYDSAFSHIRFAIQALKHFQEYPNSHWPPNGSIGLRQSLYSLSLIILLLLFCVFFPANSAGSPMVCRFRLVPPRNLRSKNRPGGGGISQRLVLFFEL